jgi:hypothetical protein
MTATHPPLVLEVLPGLLAVCRMDSGSAFPGWAQYGTLLALVRTTDELSVVCAQECVPVGVHAEAGWRAIKVLGPLEFALVGVLAGLAQPLAQAGVSLFAISTFDTDYVLVKENKLDSAIQALTAAGFEVRG